MNQDTKIVKKPISHKQLVELKKLNNPLANIILGTGVRIAELKRLVDSWDPVANPDYLDIVTKWSRGHTNRIFLTKEVQFELTRAKMTMSGKTIRTYTNRFKDMKSESGIDFTAHNLRSTFATLLIMSGVDLVSVQTLMNHSHISQTAKYVVLEESHLRVALETTKRSETFEGMNIFEAKQEILRLRKRLYRMESVFNITELVEKLDQDSYKELLKTSSNLSYLKDIKEIKDSNKLH